MKKILILVLMMVLLVGCADDEIIGKWLDISTGQIIEFNAETCNFAEMDVKYTAEDGEMILFVQDMEQLYNYSIVDDELTLTIPGVDDLELHYVRVVE